MLLVACPTGFIGVGAPGQEANRRHGLNQDLLLQLRMARRPTLATSSRSSSRAQAFKTSSEDLLARPLQGLLSPRTSSRLPSSPSSPARATFLLLRYLLLPHLATSTRDLFLEDLLFSQYSPPSSCVLGRPQNLPSQLLSGPCLVTAC